MTNMTIGSYASASPPPPLLPAQTVTQAGDMPVRDEQAGSITKAVYFSPVVQIDPKSRIALLVFRDTETGKVKDKFSMDMTLPKTDTDKETVGDAKPPASDNKEIRQYEKTAESAKNVEIDKSSEQEKEFSV